ncbi:MAG: hypothetical protein ACYCPS_02675 [Candidatus Saccharimonadales bacterium]
MPLAASLLENARSLAFAPTAFESHITSKFILVICINGMVSPLGVRRKTLYSDLIILDRKLEGLGLIEIDGNIVYLDFEEEEVGNV